MKNKFYKILFAACLLLSFIVTSNVKAQTQIYSQNFDSLVLTFPAGWSADTANGGWVVDSTNVDTIPGSSGHQNMAIKNATGISGTYKLYSKTISTSGFDNINVLWDARLTKHFSDSGSVIQSFDYSTNGGSTWTNVPYTENSNTSLWSADNGGSRINLPAGAGNQASVEFRWVAILASTSSGTYRIDDFNVQGTLANGIKEYINPDSFKAYIDGDKFLHVQAKSSDNLPAACLITISDVSGKVCLNERVVSNDNTYSLIELTRGIYFIKITSGNDLLFAQKIMLN